MKVFKLTFQLICENIFMPFPANTECYKRLIMASLISGMQPASLSMGRLVLYVGKLTNLVENCSLAIGGNKNIISKY